MSQLVFIILINVTIFLAVALGIILFLTLRQRKQRQQAITNMLSGITKQQSGRTDDLQQKLPDPGQSDGGNSLAVRELAMAENTFYQQLLVSLLDPSGNKLTQVPTNVQTLLDQYVTTLAGHAVEQADKPTVNESENPPTDSEVDPENQPVDPTSLQNTDDIEVSLDLDALDEEVETKTIEPNQPPTETGPEDPDDIEVTLDLDELDALAEEEVETKTTEPNQPPTETGPEDPDDIEVTLDLNELDALAEEETVAADAAPENLDEIEVTMELDDLDEPEITAPENPEDSDDKEAAQEQQTETTEQAINQNTDSTPNKPAPSAAEEPTEDANLDADSESVEPEQVDEAKTILNLDALDAPDTIENEDSTEQKTIDPAFAARDEDELEFDFELDVLAELDNAEPTPEDKQASPVDTSNSTPPDHDDIELTVGRTQDHQPNQQSQTPKEIPDKPLK